ncbi:hypothetical protein V8G54_023850 [Vigna mungo]|uniref:Transmembrane protein n=1 Tax=Vigna mungo TaxID=3915 RepID=A0AAQ3N4W1_VIGMU
MFNILQSSVMFLSFHQYGTQQINYTRICSVRLTLKIVFKNTNSMLNLTTFFVQISCLFQWIIIPITELMYLLICNSSFLIVSTINIKVCKMKSKSNFFGICCYCF